MNIRIQDCTRYGNQLITEASTLTQGGGLIPRSVTVEGVTRNVVFVFSSTERQEDEVVAWHYVSTDHTQPIHKLIVCND